MRYFEFFLAYQDRRSKTDSLIEDSIYMNASRVAEEILIDMDKTYGPTCGNIDLDHIYTVDDIIDDNYYTYFKIKETN